MPFSPPSPDTLVEEAGFKPPSPDTLVEEAPEFKDLSLGQRLTIRPEVGRLRMPEEMATYGGTRGLRRLPTLEEAAEVAQLPMQVAEQVGAAAFGLGRTGLKLMTPTTWLPPGQKPQAPFVLPFGEGEIRPRTAAEMETAEPIQPGKRLYTPAGTALTPEGNELQRLLSRWSTPGSVAVISARLGPIGAGLLFTSMAPGLISQIKDITAGKGTDEEKRDRVNDLVALAVLAAKGKAEPAIREGLKAPPTTAEDAGPITAAAYRDPTTGEVHTGANHPEILDRLGIKGFESRESRNTADFGYQTKNVPFVPRDQAGPIAKRWDQQLEPFDVAPSGKELPHSDEIAGKPGGEKPLGEGVSVEEMRKRGSAIGAEHYGRVRGRDLFRFTDTTVEPGKPNQITFTVPEGASKEVVAAAQKLAHVRARVADGIPEENIQVMVNNLGEQFPGGSYVSVDEVRHPRAGNVFSANPEVMKQAGYEMPSSQEFLKLPSGRYRLPEARAKLAELAKAKPAEPAPVPPAAPAAPPGDLFAFPKAAKPLEAERGQIQRLLQTLEEEDKSGRLWAKEGKEQTVQKLRARLAEIEKQLLPAKAALEAPAPAAPAATPPRPTLPPVAPGDQLQSLRNKRTLWETALARIKARAAAAEAAFDKLKNISGLDDPKVQDARATWQRAERNREKLEQSLSRVGGEIGLVRMRQEAAAVKGIPQPMGTQNITGKVLKTQKEHLLRQVDQAIKEAPEKGKGKITISVPGDGDFTIDNTKDALKRFRTLAKEQFPEAVGGLKEPKLPSKKGKAIPKVSEPDAEDVPALVGDFVSDDPSRFVLNWSYADGTQIVATDGRQLIRIVTDKAPGTPDAPVRFTRKGEVAPEAEGRFPNWKQVSDPKAELLYGGMDTGQLLHIIRQAQVFRDTSETDTSARANLAVSLFVNPDRSLGAKMQIHGDTFEHNLQPNALRLGSYNPDYLANAIVAARKLGNQKVDVYAHNGESGALGITGKNHESLTMPVGGAQAPKEGEVDVTLRDPASKFLNVAGRAQHGRLPEGLGPFQDPEARLTETPEMGAAGKWTVELEKGEIRIKRDTPFKNYRGARETRWAEVGAMKLSDWPKAAGEQLKAVKRLFTEAPVPEVKGARDVIAKKLQRAILSAIEKREGLVTEVAKRRQRAPSPGMVGPGAQAATEPPYPAASQLIDQLKATPPAGTREKLTARERIADAWAKGKSLTDAAVGKALAVGQTIKETFMGRKPTEIDDPLGELDWLLQNSSARSQQMGKAMLAQQPNATIRRAVALWIDTPGDAATKAKTLSDALQDLQLNPELWRRTPAEVRRALEMAAHLPPEAVQFAESLRQYNGIREQDAIQHGIFGEMDSQGNIIRGGLDDYFTHVWGKPENMPDDLRAALSNGRVSDYFQFARKRKLGMFLDGIMRGMIPELDPAKVMPHYNYTLDRAIASRAFIKNLTDNLVAPDGRAALAPTGTVSKLGEKEAPEGTLIRPKGRTDAIADYRQVDHPALRKWKWAVNDENGNPVLSLNDLVVHPDYYERLARFMDRGRLTPTNWGRVALRASTEVKGFKLGLLSAFHQVHVSSHALFHWTLPFNFKDARFFDAEGKINWDSPDVRHAVEKGHLKIAPDPHEIAAASEGLMSGGLVHKLPIVGPWSRAYSEFTFGEWIPKLKLKTFANALERNRRWYGNKLTEDQIAARVGDSVNNAFGELNNLFLGKFGRDPRFQRLLRGIFLAPDFGEARLRFVEKAATRFGGEERLALATMFLTLYTGARVANWLSHGDPEIDPKHAFEVKVGNHWWSMRSVLGDLDRAITDSGRFFYVRLNPLYSRTAADWLFGRDVNGRKLSATEKFITRPLNQLVPIQMQALTRDDQKMWESFVTAMGVSARSDSPQQDIRALARKWALGNADPKIKAAAEKREQEVFPPSDYTKLRFALSHDDQAAAQKALNELLKTRSWGQVSRAMNPNLPFSGSRQHERKFLDSLSASQRQLYDRAIQDRKDMYERFRNLERRTPATP
jgi:hypothetical protein